MGVYFCDISILLTLIFGIYMGYSKRTLFFFKWMLILIFSFLLSAAFAPDISEFIIGAFHLQLKYIPVIVFISMFFIVITLFYLAINLLGEHLKFAAKSIIGKFAASLLFSVLLLHLLIPFCEFLGAAEVIELVFNKDVKINLTDLEKGNINFLSETPMKLSVDDVLVDNQSSFIGLVNLKNKKIYGNSLLNISKIKDYKIEIQHSDKLFLINGDICSYTKSGYQLIKTYDELLIKNKDDEIISYCHGAFLYNQLRIAYSYSAIMFTFIFPFLENFQEYVLNSLW